MATIARALSYLVSAESPEVDVFKMIVLFCGVGLLVSLLLILGFAYLPSEPRTLDVMDWV